MEVNMNRMALVCVSGAAAIAAVVSGAALAGDSHDSDRFANRIAGLWKTDAVVGPCGSTPTRKVNNTLLFNANGTLLDNPRIGPNGIPVAAGTYQRGWGLGTWTYDARKNRYFIHVQFDRYVNNSYTGFTTVDREIVLSQRATVATGPVHVVEYDVNGEPIEPNEVCGEATSTRL
jgi:hypothetical protein